MGRVHEIGFFGKFFVIVFIYNLGIFLAVLVIMFKIPKRSLKIILMFWKFYNLRPQIRKIYFRNSNPVFNVFNFSGNPFPFLKKMNLKKMNFDKNKKNHITNQIRNFGNFQNP